MLLLNYQKCDKFEDFVQPIVFHLYLKTNENDENKIAMYNIHE